MSRVYILGAGASAGYENGERGIQPPVAEEFFQVVFRLLSGDHGLDRSCFSKLFEFLTKYYGISEAEDAFRELDIEEVLTLLDVEKATFRTERRQLLDLITLTLDKVIYADPCTHHSRLVKSLNPGDAIITFNWDLLLENVVSKSHHGGPDYGTEKLEPIPATSAPASNQPNAPLVLKPHGSMNWMTCEPCQTYFNHIGGGKTAAVYHAGENVSCRRCNGPTEPLMIPPTAFKSYQHPVISDVRDTAAWVLRRADEIVVIGYSLPPTDYKAQWLFMKASATRSVGLRSLTIVDKCPDRLKAKFRQVFHSPDSITRTIKGGIADVPPAASCH